MLFSQPELATAMAQQFECCWESMRDVPRASIDLGNGEVLERTLGGNVITWFCLADGRAYDVQPGLLDAASYGAVLRRAAETYRSLSSASQAEASDFVTRAIDWARSESGNWGAYVDAQIRSAVGETQGRVGARDAERLRVLVEAFPVDEEPPPLERAILKRALESSLLTGIAMAPDPDREVRLQSMWNAESQLSHTVLRPQALGLLSCAPLSTPAELAPHVYRLVFATDLADPFLSMAPEVEGRRDAFTGLGIR